MTYQSMTDSRTNSNTSSSGSHYNSLSISHHLDLFVLFTYFEQTCQVVEGQLEQEQEE
jgi:hypothetical protein